MASASISSYIRKAKTMMPAIMVAMLLYNILGTTVGSEAARPAQSICPEGTLVYPYWSLCTAPALYSVEQYQFVSVAGSAQGYLAPEWDESNSTYYLRLADEGANYILTYNSTSELRAFVAETDNVVIENADTGRVLAWRQEGEDEYFLVEVEDTAAAAQFQFSQSQDVSLPCPRIYSAVCQAYDILSYSTSTSGLGAYEEDGGAIYFRQLPSDDLLPFVLRRSSSAASINKSQQGAAIKSVVA